MADDIVDNVLWGCGVVAEKDPKFVDIKNYMPTYRVYHSVFDLDFFAWYSRTFLVTLCTTYWYVQLYIHHYFTEDCKQWSRAKKIRDKMSK